LAEPSQRPENIEPSIVIILVVVKIQQQENNFAFMVASEGLIQAG